MTTKTIDIAEARDHLPELLRLAISGTEVIIVAGDRPLARLSPIIEGERGTRIAGLHEGQARIADDFDAPLPDAFWLGQP